MDNSKKATTIIILGATGDLARKKLFPALFGLYKKDKLPKNMKVVGFSRRNFKSSDFRQFLIENVPNFKDRDEKITDFLNLVEYSEGKFDDPTSYESLINLLQKIDEKFGNCSDKLFHLAVSPAFYELVLQNMHKTGLTLSCTDGTGKTKIIIEKPIGHDLKTAKEIHSLINKIATRDQIYEIDHYLTKETLHAAKTLSEKENLRKIWNNEHIESIDITLFETKDIEGRGEFYDSLGALRDVGQNHALIVLSHMLQENGAEKNVQKRRADILKNALKLEAVAIKDIVRGQYIGYLKEKGVENDSETETFFKFPVALGDKKWEGVKITVAGGKGLSKNEVGVKVIFKKPETFKLESKHLTDIKEILFRIQPEPEAIFTDKTDKKEVINLKGKTYQGHSSESYEKLFLEVFKGNEDLFVSEEEVEASWVIVDQIHEIWTKLPLIKYEKGKFPN
ncbi:MAG: hypothetical protein AAB534_01120 [Patescibacteria group bacterium]